MAKPYTFQPVFDIEGAIDLGRRLVAGKAGFAELKDASGIAGCALEKLDGEALIAEAASEDLSGKSLEELGEMLQAAPAEEEAGGAVLSWLLPIILQIVMRIIQNRLGGGGTNPIPGPV